MSLFNFAVSRKVKNLDLHFLNPYSITTNEAETKARVFQLSGCFYTITSLESLKVFACGFDPSRLAKIGSLKILFFGWIQLRDIMSLILKCRFLESLSIKNCLDVGHKEITRYNSQ